jgi:hypothetical protein
MAYVNFDSAWVAKTHPNMPGDTAPRTLIGYRVDGELAFTEMPDGFSVPCIVEEVGGQTRIRFDNTFWVRWHGGHGDTDTHNEWFGKQSCYFADYLDVSSTPLFPLVELTMPDMPMR